jgi:tight adherence protein B
VSVAVKEPWILYGLVFGATLLAVEGLYWIVFQSRGAKKAINRRLALGEKNSARTEVFAVLRQERGFADHSSGALAGLGDFFVQTGLRVSMTALVLWGLIVAVLVAAPMALLTHRVWLGAAAGVALAPLIVAVYLSRARARRIARFGLQLPDALDIIVRGLRVGHPFTSAVELVARELPDPIGTEFGLTADEMSFGQDILSAVNNLYRRVGQEDLLFLVIGVSVQSQTGGNLAEVLARLGALMRERVKMRLKVHALSAEGRMSAWVLSAMPFALFAIVRTIAPTYFDELEASPALAPALIYGLASIVIANFFIYRMVNFKV